MNPTLVVLLLLTLLLGLIPQRMVRGARDEVA
jgi:hypothetical protein